jgi:hypothetical protein
MIPTHGNDNGATMGMSAAPMPWPGLCEDMPQRWEMGDGTGLPARQQRDTNNIEIAAKRRRHTRANYQLETKT